MIKCKYKKFDNERFCQILNGECQFITCRYGEKCPIYNAFKDYDKYAIEQSAKNNGGVAKIQNIAMSDVLGGQQSEAKIETLNITPGE